MIIIIKPGRLLLLRYWVKCRGKYISPGFLGVEEDLQTWLFDNSVTKTFVFVPDLWLLQIYDYALGRLACLLCRRLQVWPQACLWPWKCELWLQGFKRWGWGECLFCSPPQTPSSSFRWSCCVVRWLVMGPLLIASEKGCRGESPSRWFEGWGLLLISLVARSTVSL